MTNTIVEVLDIPFKEFTSGQVIQAKQFNDDMIEIEDTVNSFIDKHNNVAQDVINHTTNVSNPHLVTASQVGAYSYGESDMFILDLKEGNLNPESIQNVILATNSVDSRVILDNCITNSKLDYAVGAQIDISNNISIQDRYTKGETDAILLEKVGAGTYDKLTLDRKFEEVQAGQIVEGTIGIEKFKPGVGTELDIHLNPALSNLVDRVELEDEINEITTNLPTKYVPLRINNEVFYLKQHVENYIGQSGEITVDIDMKTLRIHDGVILGGHIIAKKDDVDFVREVLSQQIDDLSNNISGSHDHDGLYAKIVHNHDNYVEKVNGLENIYSTYKNNYHGLCDKYGDDGGWYRTTRNGLIPYQSGGYGSIGSPSWRFNEGWFNTLNASTIVIPKNGVTSSIEFPSYGNDPGFIRHIESPTDTASMCFSVSDNPDGVDRFYFGSTPNGVFSAGSYITSDGQMRLNGGLSTGSRVMSMGGVNIYFEGSRPSDAPEGSISFG